MKSLQRQGFLIFLSKKRLKKQNKTLYLAKAKEATLDHGAQCPFKEEFPGF